MYFNNIKAIVTNDRPHNSRSLKFVDNEICYNQRRRVKEKITMTCAGKKKGRYFILLKKTRRDNVLILCEVVIFGVRGVYVEMNCSNTQKSLHNFITNCQTRVAMTLSMIPWQTPSRKPDRSCLSHECERDHNRKRCAKNIWSNFENYGLKISRHRIIIFIPKLMRIYFGIFIFIRYV